MTENNTAFQQTSDYSETIIPAEAADQTLVVAEEKPWQFSAFRELIEEDLLHADQVLRKLLQALQAGGFSEDPFCKDIEYLVQKMDEEETESGETADGDTRTGEIFAELNRSGKTSRKPHAEKIVKGVGLDAEDVWQAISLKAMEHALIRLSDLLNEISDAVNAVSRGEKDDRAALYRSGQNQAAEAMKIRDLSFQKLLLIQVIKTLSDAGAEVTLEMERYIEFLKAGSLKKNDLHRQASETAVRVIGHWLEVIHHSYELKAFIYYQQKELPAMIETLEAYALFLKNAMVKNQKLFAEYDPGSTFLFSGDWEERVRSLREITGKHESLMRSAASEEPLKMEEEPTAAVPDPVRKDPD